MADKCSAGHRRDVSNNTCDPVVSHNESVEGYFQSKALKYEERSRNWLWKWLRELETQCVGEMLGDIRGCIFLEFGCGAGFFSRLLLEKGASHVWALDVSSNMLDQLPYNHVTPILGDAANYQIGRQFDRALSAGLLEFVSDPAEVLANLADHVRTGGVATVLFPITNIAGLFYRSYHRRHGLMLHLFEVNEFTNLAERTGWIVTAINRCGLFSAVVNLRRNS